MIHEEKRNGRGRRPQRRKKHLRSDRSAWETTFKKHLNHPFTVMQPFVLQHTCTRTQTHKKKKKAVGEVMKIITSTLLMTGWTNQVKNTLNSLKPQQAS